jgi:hypothetical protein
MRGAMKRYRQLFFLDERRERCRKVVEALIFPGAGYPLGRVDR